MGSGADFDLLAASLRADGGDLSVFVSALADKLERALPHATRVKRPGGFGRRKTLEIAVELGETRHELRYEGRAVAATVAGVVRGIVLKTETLSLDEWIESLARTLAAEAERSASARQALEQLLGVGTTEDKEVSS